jgi:hypothetical protein
MSEHHFSTNALHAGHDPKVNGEHALYPFIKVLPTFSTIQIMRPTSSPWLNLGIFTVE